MRKPEIRAAGDVAGEALAALGTLVEDTHKGVAGRSFDALGALGAPVRVLHDGLSAVVYGGVRGSLRAASRLGAGAVAGRVADERPALASRPAGAAAVAALNGLYGNHLTDRGNALALAMELLRDGTPVTTDAEGLATAFPDATSRIVVLVHGLCETDASWRRPPLRAAAPSRRTYGERLQDELSFTPVDVRYNTGLRVAANGRELARLLEELVTGWPTGVEELVLVGHSMGGLVARSACHYGELGGCRWTDAVSHVFCLGTPHLGADLEKGANALGWVLGRLPETRGVARVLNARSVGVKDLRFGSCAEEDWSGSDPDEFLRDRCREVPFLPDARYCFIGSWATCWCACRAPPAAGADGGAASRSRSTTGTSSRA
jgi:pimeloyl-ACP methyl ester carboxylesterase